MILVRYTFQTKWGKAQEVVDDFKSMAEAMRKAMGGANVHGRVLTDLSGPFHTVVQELEVESLADWEKMRAAMFSTPEFQQEQTGEPPFESGGAEFYTIEFVF
jgi:hypothetical protein